MELWWCGRFDIVATSALLEQPRVRFEHMGRAAEDCWMKLCQLKPTERTMVVVSVLRGDNIEEEGWLRLLERIRVRWPAYVFLCVLCHDADDQAALRARLFDQQTCAVNMFSRADALSQLLTAVKIIAKSASQHRQQSNNQAAGTLALSKSASPPLSTLLVDGKPLPSYFTCPICNASGLTEHQLWQHVPLYHVNHPNSMASVSCPICRKQCQKPWRVHLRNSHGPCLRGMIRPENWAHKRYGNTLYAFALVYCIRPRDGRVLLVHEYAGNGFWIPGGRVEAMEDMESAAIRETKEETGLDVELTGILRVEHTALKGYTRLRVTFYAIPVNQDQVLKSIPDYESVGACWVPVSTILSGELPLRGKEPVQWARYFQEGGVVYPLSLLKSVSLNQQLQ